MGRGLKKIEPIGEIKESRLVLKGVLVLPVVDICSGERDMQVSIEGKLP